MRPDATTMAIGGQRSRMAKASFKPFMDPGISMSENTTAMSGRFPRPGSPRPRGGLDDVVAGVVD